jgi:hypothetical protein
VNTLCQEFAHDVRLGFQGVWECFLGHVRVAPALRIGKAKHDLSSAAVEVNAPLSEELAALSHPFFIDGLRVAEHLQHNHTST